MSFISNTIIAISMSADAFAASVSKGVALKKPKLKYALGIGLIFGLIETITPIKVIIYLVSTGSHAHVFKKS